MTVRSASLSSAAASRVPHRERSTLDVLRSCPLFACMAEDELQNVASRAVRRSHRRGEILQRQGDHPGHLQLLMSGTVKLSLEAATGEEFLIRVVGPGHTWGEIAVIDGAEVAFTATALEQAEVVVVWQADVQAAFRTNRDFARRLARHLTAQLRQTAHLIELTTFYPLDVGLARCLSDLGEEHGRRTSDGIVLDLPLTQSDLASMLGATRVRINLLLGRFQDEGLVRLGRGTITLINPRELQRRACR